MSKQQELEIESQVNSVGEYKFEPIKGYPMLNWKGKRPFTGTQYYPAQLKESYGESVNGWLNKIFWGDNLQVMSHLLKEYRGKVQLIYIDPPFDSKADYKKKIQLRGQSITNDQSNFEEKQYTDIWTNDDYLQFMYERLNLMRELLSDTGSIYLHCDWRKNHHLRMLMEEVYGESRLVNQIVWKRRTNTIKGISNKFSTNTDYLLFFSKSESFKFNIQYESYGDGYEDRFKYEDDFGKYRWQVMATFSKERYEKLEADGKVRHSKNAKFPEFKQYLHELKGRPIQDVWDDINMINAMGGERQNYPTQKPEALLERVIEASSNEGDIVFDCFMGSGTTQAVAMKLGRRFIGADINLGAVQITTKRLLNIAKYLQSNQQKSLDDSENKPATYYTGLEVYNVNHYDVFRNPIQAKDLLVQALELNPLPKQTSVFDGEKDGWMVKIMPVNRIATRADLNEIITGLDWKAFEKNQSLAPSKSVQKIQLVCMGHEPQLADVLKQEALPYKIDVEVVDILRNKQQLQFKRDSEAEIVIENNQVVVKSFYPMNLLEKLSLEKTNVTDWRELVESIMIDFNYDGAVLEPTVVDIPERNELVTGHYSIPESSGTIHIKITDLLSESFEMDIYHG
jgi:adenine-specific DNA-methyltransferase